VKLRVTSQLPFTRNDLRKLMPVKKVKREMIARADKCSLSLHYYDSQLDEKDHKHGPCGCRRSEDKTVPLVGTYKGPFYDPVKAKARLDKRRAEEDKEVAEGGHRVHDGPYPWGHYPTCELNVNPPDDAETSMALIVPTEKIQYASIEFPKWAHEDPYLRSIPVGHKWPAPEP
jgi:hypothetical protein